MANPLVLWGAEWEKDFFIVRPNLAHKAMKALKLTPQEMEVMDILVSFRDSTDSFVVAANIDRVAERIGVDRSSVDRSVRALIKKNVLGQHSKPYRGKTR